MSTRSEKERQKQVQDKCQAILSQLLRDEDNKYCVDCDAKGPRWASWNLGIFLCIRCAGIHRNLGVHISKVKSVNLDTWTPEQVACLQQMGNSRARAVYEANLPDSFRRPHTDSSLEAFIRAKYEQKKYIAKEWVPPPMPKPAFEIEDEKKKSSEKKARSKATGLESPVPNAIPAPKLKSNTPTRPASSPTPPPIGSQNKASTETKATPKPSATVDLLGLDDPVVGSPQSNDPFGSFLSAADNVDTSPAIADSTLSTATTTASTVSQPSSTPSGKSEEENFFSQTSQQEAQKKQAMTKESILSLYGQSSAPHQPVYGMPGALYVNQPSFPAQPVGMGYSGVPVAPSAPIGMVPNGMMSTAAPVGVVANGMMAPATANSSLLGNVQHLPSHPQPGTVGAANHLVGTNPFLNPGMSGIYAPTTNMAPAGLAQFDVFTVDRGPVDLMWDFRYPHLTSMNNNSSTSTNPYFLLPATQLPPQMANLSLASGGLMAQQPVGIVPGAPAWSSQPTGHTLSTNLWQ